MPTLQTRILSYDLHHLVENSHYFLLLTSEGRGCATRKWYVQSCISVISFPPSSSPPSYSASVCCGSHVASLIILDPRQRGLSQFGMDTSRLVREAQRRIDVLLAEWVLQDRLPFALVESESMRAFIQSLNPNYRLPCRQSLKSRVSFISLFAPHPSSTYDLHHLLLADSFYLQCHTLSCSKARFH